MYICTLEVLSASIMGRVPPVKEPVFFSVRPSESCDAAADDSEVVVVLLGELCMSFTRPVVKISSVVANVDDNVNASMRLDVDVFRRYVSVVVEERSSNEVG